ncbi:MAG: ubiquinol oxidase subunit II [Chlamydiales bacterium]
MNKTKLSVLFLLLFTGIVSLAILILQPLEVLHFRDYIALLFPKGSIALKERNLLLILQAIMLLVVIPVYIFTFIFSWKYRANNKKSNYDPDLVDHRVAEYFWWGIPFVITLAICIITWVKTYELDPFKPIASDKTPLRVQVVALQWKWLFIYPDEGIATVNLLQIPTQTPVQFEITADAPMNSFWIPHLGGQIYAMPRMKSVLHLIADEEGDFRGCSANISGEGFAQMYFMTRASKEEEYREWVESIKQSKKVLSLAEYEKLATPSLNQPIVLYQRPDESLFDYVLMKFDPPKKEE